MRATSLALIVALSTATACRSAAPSAPPASAQAQVTPRERFEDVKHRWEAARRAELDAWHAYMERLRRGEEPLERVDSNADRDRILNGLPEFLVLYAECEGLAVEVPEALQFCLAAASDIELNPWPMMRKPGVETLQRIVRAAPDSESVDRCLWRLWNGSAPQGDARYSYLAALSRRSGLPRDSLARGWGDLAEVVWVHGIGAPDAWSHDPRLTLDALGGIESDHPGTAVARHARALRRTVEAFEDAAPAPALVLLDTNGRSLSLVEQRGDCVVILFWDPNDPSSQLALHGIQQLHLPVRQLGIQVGGENADVARLMKGFQDSWRTAVVAGLNDSVLENWGVRALPASFLVDREGRLRAVDQFGEGLERTAKNLLASTFVDSTAR